MEEGNGSPQERVTPRRQLSPSTWLVLLMFILLMRANYANDGQSDEMEQSIHNLQYELSNYTAWLNSTETGFTLNDYATEKHLLDSLVTPSPLSEDMGYFQNVSGSFYTRDIRIFNLTSPSSGVSWFTIAEEYMKDVNNTEVMDRVNTWNWAASARAILGVFDFIPESVSDDNEGYVNRFRASIDLEHENPDGALVASQTVNLRIDGIHFPKNGTLFGLAEPKGISRDIRQLPALVPLEALNTTAHLIADEMTAYFERVKSSFEAGTLQAGEESEVQTTCPFRLYGFVRPIDRSQEVVDAVEKEQNEPSGVPVPVVPPLVIDAVLVSRECGLLIELEGLQGERTDRWYRRAINYAAFACAVYVVLLVLMIHISEEMRSAMTMMNISRPVIGTMLFMDTYSAISHIMGAYLSDGRLSLAMMAPGFLSITLGIIDMRFFILVGGTQAFATPTTPAPQPPQLSQPALSASPAVSANTHPTPLSLSTVFAHLRILQAQARRLIAWIRAEDERIWFFTTSLVCLYLWIRISLPWHGSWLIFASSTWVGQIVRNVMRGSRRVFKKWVVLLMSCGRLAIPMYLLACPRNLVELDVPHWWWIIPCWVVGQISILFLQDSLGPSFFLPSAWRTAPFHDYHPLLPLGDEESAEPKTLGDCSICMDPIDVTEGDREPSAVDESETGSVLRRSLWRMASVARKKRTYSMAPCGHNFHTGCLEQWLDIKNICPQCRRPLPAL